MNCARYWLAERNQCGQQLEELLRATKQNTINSNFPLTRQKTHKSVNLMFERHGSILIFAPCMRKLIGHRRQHCGQLGTRLPLELVVEDELSDQHFQV